MGPSGEVTIKEDVANNNVAWEHAAARDELLKQLRHGKIRLSFVHVGVLNLPIDIDLGSASITLHVFVRQIDSGKSGDYVECLGRIK